MLRLRSRLRIAEISVLIQARTDRTGLAKFLYDRKVPGILLATCRYEAREETPEHMTLGYTEEEERGQDLRAGRRVDYQQMAGTKGNAKRLVVWMILSGKLGQLFHAEWICEETASSTMASSYGTV